MPDHSIQLSDDDRALLARVQAQHGLPTLESAAEWLVKMRLRRAAEATAGRRRALRLVARRPGGAA